MATVQLTIQGDYPVDETRVRLVVERVLTLHSEHAGDVVSVVVTDEAAMQTLNREYHEIDAPTDVLSFPYTDPLSKHEKDDGTFVVPQGELPILGDLAVCYPVAQKQALEKGISVEEEIDFLVEHGMLHLLGHHHD